MPWKHEFIELILHVINCICTGYLIHIVIYILSSTENGEEVCRLFFDRLTDSQLEREWKHNYNMNRGLNYKTLYS